MSKNSDILENDLLAFDSELLPILLTDRSKSNATGEPHNIVWGTDNYTSNGEGYGESMIKMVITYILTVFLFAWLFCSNVSLLEYGQAVAVSLKNMAGMDSDVIHEVSPFVDMLNVVQTTIGIILTGIFGFILGNKIRNQ